LKKRVLIVDDDAATRRLLTDIVSDYNVEVLEAAEDDEAHKLFIETGPDLIFLDVLLPRHGGIKFLKDIRKLRSGLKVPVLMMSAVYRGADIRNEVLKEINFVDFLRKPFQLDVLHSRLSELLKNESENAREPAAPFSPSDIVESGNLTDINFPLLLKDLAYHKTTGCLHVKNGARKKVVFFRDGEVGFVSSNQLRETLGRLLLDTGAINDEIYQLGLGAMLGKRMKLGEFLIKNGYLRAQEIFEAVRANIFEKIMDLFAWREAEFNLTKYREPPAILPGRPFEVSHLLREGIRTNFPKDLMAAAMAPHENLAVLVQRDFFELATEISLDQEDLQTVRLLRRLRGSKLSQVIHAMEGEREVRFLYYLLLAGYMTLGREEIKGEEGRKLDMAEILRLRKARRQLNDLRTRNHFQILGVAIEASDEEVREAYLSLAKEVHPDMLDDGDIPQLKEIHVSIFQLIMAAYEALRTEKKRKQYLRSIREHINGKPLDGTEIIEAERLFRAGKDLLKKRKWAEATEALRKAFEINPDEGEHSLFFAIALSKRSTGENRDAGPKIEELLKKARELLPDSPEPSYRLGKLALQQGNEKLAERYFRNAVFRDANHIESLRELRLIKMRRSKGKGKMISGFLGRSK